MKEDQNIGEELSFEEEHLALGRELSKRITKLPLSKLVIAVAGESGCGKSTTAFCLEKELKEKGMNCAILHMDSYFKLPPKDNHQNRVKSLDNVGPQELNISLVNEHIESFKKGSNSIVIPVVQYLENRFTEKELDLSNIDVLIVEGVYAMMLKNLDHKIFLSRTYHETLENRAKRTREKYDPIVELVLEIEHKIVEPMRSLADTVISKNYTIE